MILQKKVENLKTCKELLLEFKCKNKVSDSSKIRFNLGIDKRDVYNITAPFYFQGKQWIAGRVEERDSEHAQICFFRKWGDIWEKYQDIEPIALQDPFITWVKDEIILGGVEIFEDIDYPGRLNYRTVFLRGDRIDQLRRFAEGPDRMKDIRLCDLRDGGILVMTRPQTGENGRGRIGYIVIHSLEELTLSKIEEAEILEHQFIPEEWGGANELHLLKNKKVGVLSHIASYDQEGNRHYYSGSFCFDPATGCYSPMKLIAVRSNFEPGPSKRPDLEDVIFSGGLIRKENGEAELYCGVGDAEGHRILIEDPFHEYEGES